MEQGEAVSRSCSCSPRLQGRYTCFRMEHGEAESKKLQSLPAWELSSSLEVRQKAGKLRAPETNKHANPGYE